MDRRPRHPLTIGKLAKSAGIGVETVRFYERKGLIAQPRKPDNGYRIYEPEVVERIRFIREAQELGFTLKETAELLSLRADPNADCAAVRNRAEAKLRDVEDKARRLDAMRRALGNLIAACPGEGSTVACTILDAFETRDQADRRQGSSLETPQPKRSHGHDIAMKTVVFTVTGMHCSGCTETVKSLLGLEEGVRTATVSLEKGEARIFYDPALTAPDTLASVIERAGYSASRPPE